MLLSSVLIWSTKLTFKTRLTVIRTIFIYILIHGSIYGSTSITTWAAANNKNFVSLLSKKTITLHKITIQTKNKTLKVKLEKQMSTYKNQILSLTLKNKIHEHLLSALKQRKILQPNIKGPFFYFKNTKVTLSYKINHPYQYALITKNNKVISDQQLLSKKIRSAIFNSPQWTVKLLRHIKNTYIAKGYSKVNVNYQTDTNHKQFTKTISLNIQEGPLLKIKAIRVKGTFSRPDTYYIRLLKKHSGSLIRKNIFYNKDFQEGIKNLTTILRQEGYLQPSIYSKVTEKDNKIIIDVILNEGQLTKVGKITFSGNHHFSDAELQRLIRLTENNPLRVHWISEDIQAIIRAYKDAGFINITLDKDKIIRYNINTSKAYLHFNITENSKFIITNIIIQGNQFTHSEFILKTSGLKQGDVLTPKKINKSIEKLRKLGMFTSTDIVTVGSNQKAPKKQTVIIKVKERKKRSIRMTIGLNTERILTVRGLTQLSHNNILGTGRRLFSNIQLQSNVARYVHQDMSIPKHLEHRGSLIYTEPFILGSLFNGQVSVSNSNTISLYNRKDNFLNIVKTNKINFLLQREIYDDVYLQWTIMSWEGRKEFEKSVRCERDRKLDPSNLTCADNILNIAGNRLALNVDKRNNVVSTSNGFLSKMFIEYAGPLYWIHGSKDVHFIKMELRHFDFRPIFSKWIWVNSIQGGVIANINPDGQGGFPVSRAFILGGVNSLRGFDGLLDGQRVPDKEEFVIAGSNQLISSSSSFFFLLKTELRFPINDNLKGSIFYDGGSVTIAGKQFEKPYRQTAGFGLRYQTMLGPISGYIAFKIAPKKNESMFTLPQLSFGTF